MLGKDVQPRDQWRPAWRIFFEFYTIAFRMATTIPIAARMKEKMLVRPPRTLGARERRSPIAPKMIATMASANPVAGLTKQHAMAAAMAMIEGILK